MRPPPSPEQEAAWDAEIEAAWSRDCLERAVADEIEAGSGFTIPRETAEEAADALVRTMFAGPLA